MNDQLPFSQPSSDHVYFDEKRTTLYGSRVAWKKLGLFQGYKETWVDLVLKEMHGFDDEGDVRHAMIIPRRGPDDSYPPVDCAALQLTQVQCLFNEEPKCKINIVCEYPSAVRYCMKMGRADELVCWKAEIDQARHVAERSSHMVFHVVVAHRKTGESMHGVLKNSSRFKSVLLVVNPLSSDHLYEWDFLAVSKVTVAYDRTVSLSISRRKANRLVTDEVILFTHSITILREFRDFIETFMKVRLAGRWSRARVVAKPASAGSALTRLSDYAEVSYEFDDAGGGGGGGDSSPTGPQESSPTRVARLVGARPPAPPVDLLRPGALPSKGLARLESGRRLGRCHVGDDGYLEPSRIF